MRYFFEIIGRIFSRLKEGLVVVVNFVRHNEKAFLLFAFQTTSYLPTIAIVGMGVMIGINREHLFDFWTFASTTISLEVCISCLREKHAIIDKIGHLAFATNSEELKQYLRERLQIAKRQASWSFVVCGVVLTMWLLIAICELWHIGDSQLPPLPSWNKSAVPQLCGFIVTTALTQMWDIAFAESKLQLEE